MTLREIKTIDMNPTEFGSEVSFKYCQGLQMGAEIAEKAMKSRAKHFLEEAIKQINKNTGLELNIEGYVKNLIHMMEWEGDEKD